MKTMFYGTSDERDCQRSDFILHPNVQLHFFSLWCQSNNSIWSMQSGEYFHTFHPSLIFDLYAANMALYVCVEHHIMFHFTLFLLLACNNMWFAVFFDMEKNNMVHSFWLMYDRCLSLLTNDKSFPTWSL